MFPLIVESKVVPTTTPFPGTWSLAQEIDTASYGFDYYDDPYLEQETSFLTQLGLDASYPVATAFFAVACAVIFHFPSIITIEKFSLWPSKIFQGKQYYRFISNVFLHADVNHLISNGIGILRWGRNCELVHGTLRLVEATIWAVMFQAAWVVLFCSQTLFRIPGTASPDDFREMQGLGFSGVLYFWIGMVFKETDDAFGKIFLAFMILEDIRKFRVDKGSLAHLTGAVSGLFYSSFIMDRFTIPTRWVQKLEVGIDSLLDGQGVEMPDFLFFVNVADVDDEEDLPSDEEKEGDQTARATIDTLFRRRLANREAVKKHSLEHGHNDQYTIDLGSVEDTLWGETCYFRLIFTPFHCWQLYAYSHR